MNTTKNERRPDDLAVSWRVRMPLHPIDADEGRP